MAFSMFSTQASPVAIDFGLSSVKLLQVSGGVAPALVAAAELSIPDEARADTESRFKFLNDALPALIRRTKFRGRKAVCSIPSSSTFVQHMQLQVGVDRDEQIKTQLQIQMGWSPTSIVVRSVEVTEATKAAQRAETICFAVPRDIVMRQVELLKKCKLEVAGVHTEQHALVWAYDHLHRRDSDEQLTDLYVDLGWGSTKVAISHGKDLVFSKIIQWGGKQLDEQVAATLSCDAPTARAHRIARCATEVDSLAKARHAAGVLPEHSVCAPGGGNGTATAVATRSAGTGTSEGFDLSEFVEAVVDELGMCMRYHGSLFPERNVTRVIFLGGEARHVGICRSIAQALQLPGRLGDPLARLTRDEDALVEGVSMSEPQPGWAVVAGLCAGATS